MKTRASTIAWYAVAAAAAIAFVVIAAVVASGRTGAIDVSLELAVHDLDAPVLDIVAKLATWIGSDFTLWPIVALVMLLAVRAKQTPAAWLLAADAVTAVLSNNLIKLAFARARPTLFDKIGLPTSYSFPSGHAMSAMAIYGSAAAVLVALVPRAKRWIVTVTTLLVFAIGMSRIYLGVHWPSDVLAGWLAGVPFVVVTVHLLHRRAILGR